MKKPYVIIRPPGVKHWHDASPTTATTRDSVARTINGKNVEWKEDVTDAQYTAH